MAKGSEKRPVAEHSKELGDESVNGIVLSIDKKRLLLQLPEGVHFKMYGLKTVSVGHMKLNSVNCPSALPRHKM